MACDQRRGLGELTGRTGMADGLIKIARLPVPGRGPPVQGHQQPRLPAVELHAEQLREQVLIAIPLAPIIQRNQEQIGAFQLLQQPRRPLRLQHGVAQRAGQALQDRGAQQEPPDGVRLAGQHLRAQVVGDMAVVAMERGDEGAGVLPAAKRQTGQDQPRRPALGPLGQTLGVAGPQLQPHRPVQEGQGFFVGELQVGDPDLGQLSPGSHPGQRQRRVATA
ncbi:MAG: hypothetical protein M3O65_03335 [Actinomycetota bacterium]|nr:hypothetical protein [Actinomycetota bacterium]